MALKRGFICIPIIIALFFSFIYADDDKSDTENKKTLGFAPSGVLEIDILQSFAEEDKTGCAGVGRLETGVEVDVGDKVNAGLFLELGDEDVTGLLETWFTFKPAAFLSLTAGQLTMPFGEYATECMTDPLVMSGYTIDSTADIPGAETIFPGCIAGVEIAGFTGAVGVYNSSYSQRLEACAVKLAYAYKEIVSAGISSRFETNKKIDLDAGLTINPWPFLALLGELYTGLNDEENDNRLLGIHSELDITPVEPLIIALRFGRLVDHNKDGSGSIQLGGCIKYVLNDHFTFGIEANGNAAIDDGETGGWDDLVMRLGCSVE